MTTTTDISGGEFVFCAAHTGLHDGEFESLHGHTFTTSVQLTGVPDEDGMLVDFTIVKQALRAALAPLRRKTLFAADSPHTTITTGDGQVTVTSATKRYQLPAEDVVILPITNTTTESIAAYLLDRLLPHLPVGVGLSTVALRLSEAPDTAATVTADLR